MATLNGQKFGKYEIVELVAQGGMAEVYKAHQYGVERTVVVKVLHCHLSQSDLFVARFRREAQAVGALQHPNIVRIIDFDVVDDVQYMVMDYVQGGTLSNRLKADQRPSIADSLTLGVQLAAALAYAHRQGVIHRDIKPGNILFADASFDHPVLTDFGLAHLCSDEETNLTMTGTMIGTPTYMSPEAVRGETCDERSDIYSWGVVLYELLTGKPPYVANTPYSMMMKQANDPLPPPRYFNPELPCAIEELLIKTLAKEPSARYQSANELIDALESLQNSFGFVTQNAESWSPQVGQCKESDTKIKERALAHKAITTKTYPTKAQKWLTLGLAIGAVGTVSCAVVGLVMLF